MPTDYETYYKTILSPKLQQLEKERISLIRKVSKYLLIIFAIVLIGGVFALLGVFQFPFFFIAACIIGLLGYLAIYQPKFSILRSKFKEEVIHDLLEYIDKGLRYKKKGCISKKDYLNGKIFLQHPDRYRGEDLIWGKIGETAIRFSEIRTEYKTTDSKGRVHYHTIFKGLYFIADFNKDFRTQVLVLPDTAEKLLGWLGKSMQKHNPLRDQLINMDNEAFEKEFVVYGGDQVEARYILSPSLMEKILDFKKAMDQDIYLSFINGQVHVAMWVSENLFEAPLFGTFKDPERIRKFYHYLDLGKRIVEEFNLNTRIWTKK